MLYDIIMDQIIRNYLNHYNGKFAEHGAKPEGVDWGSDPTDLRLRLDRVLAVMEKVCPIAQKPSILEIGCGYGSMYAHLESKGIEVDFTGIDLCESMIAAAAAKHPGQSWNTADIFTWENDTTFDYVLCNGLVNLKLEASLQEIKQMSKRLLRKMLSLSRIGCSLNFMTTNVNYFAPHLYYQNPVELLGWCMSELTTRVRLDHAYSLYEFTIHLYHEHVDGMKFGSHREHFLAKVKS